MREVRDANVTPVQQILASCSGAFITAFFANPLDVVKVRLQKQTTPKSCVTPLDVVKVRLQAQRSPAAYSRCFIVSSGLMDHLCTFCGFPGGGGSVSRFSGTMDAFLKISRHEGIRALWSGLTPALCFCHFDKPLRNGQNEAAIEKHEILWCNVVGALNSMIRQNGLKSLYLGLGPTLLRDVPFSGMVFKLLRIAAFYLDIRCPSISKKLPKSKKARRSVPRSSKSDAYLIL
ncbi:hypothetical protein D918_05598 [Trichuris suis]|nr:hypothetical protein D918_05598 [Trichuris suis]